MLKSNYLFLESVTLTFQYQRQPLVQPTHSVAAGTLNSIDLTFYGLIRMSEKIYDLHVRRYCLFLVSLWLHTLAE